MAYDVLLAYDLGFIGSTPPPLQTPLRNDTETRSNIEITQEKRIAISSTDNRQLKTAIIYQMIQVVTNLISYSWRSFNPLPSRELTYSPKMAFWRWFSFSQRGIC